MDCGPRLKDCRGDEKGAIEPFRGDDLPHPSFPKFSIGNPNAFKYCGPLIESFRGDASSVIPEIFNRESTFLLFSLVFKTMDPGLKIAGVTDKRQ